MATIIVPPVNSDPSMADLRAMIASTNPAPVKTESKSETSETVPPVEGETAKPQTATEPVEKKPEPSTEETEPELSEGVKKKIAKEVDRATRAQSEIDKVVSTRKEKEAELSKLKAGEKGSEPVNKPQSSAAEPKLPVPGEPGHESESWDQYEARKTEFIKAGAIREFEQRQAAKDQQKAAQERWDVAVKEHGAEFPALVESARRLAPEGLQIAISMLDGWSGVAVHLAKNPQELKDLSAVYQQNPTKAIATLGRIEAALSSSKETKSAATSEKPLPEPIKKIGGTASASGEDFQTTVENSSMSQLRGIVEKARKK